MDTTVAEQEIREVIDLWMRATAHGDLEQVLELMDEEVIFLMPGRPPMQGREEFAVSFQAMPANSRIEGTSETRDIRISGDFAYVWTQLSVAVTPADGGPVIRREGPTLSVFRKARDGRWKLFRDANMLAPA